MRGQINGPATCIYQSANQCRRCPLQLQVNSTAALRVGTWYLIALPQDAPDFTTKNRRRALLAQPAQVAGCLQGLFSNPALQAAAYQAAEQELGVLQCGAAARLSPVAASTAARQLNPLLQGTAKYAAEGALADCVAAGALPAAAMAPSGSVDAYLYGDNLVDSGEHDAMFTKADRMRFPFRCKCARGCIVPVVSCAAAAPLPPCLLHLSSPHPHRIVRKGASWVELDRPVPLDLRTTWAPRIYPYAPTVQRSGIQDLTVQFKWGEHMAPGAWPSSSAGQ